jgi:hypothetical protein
VLENTDVFDEVDLLFECLNDWRFLKIFKTKPFTYNRMIRILLLFCFRHCRIRSTSMTNEAIYIYVWKNPCAILSRKKIIVNCLFRLLVVSAHAHRLIPGIYSNTIKLTKRKKEMNNSNANSRTLILINEIQIRIQKEIRN